jgi:hypothetical protein
MSRDYMDGRLMPSHSGALLGNLHRRKLSFEVAVLPHIASLKN